MIPMTLGEVASAVRAAEGPWNPDLRARGVTTDSRAVKPGDLFIAIRGERFDGHDFLSEALSGGAVACVCDQQRVGHEPTTLVVTETVEALGRLAAHYRRKVMPVATVVVAVTGSNGKTTTKSMMDHVLCGSLKGRAAPKSFNNKIGVPLTLLSADADDRYLIVEVGSNAPGEVAALAEMTAPDAAVITSIGEAHLEGLGGIEGVAKEKVSLLDHVRPDGLAVVNIDRSEIRLHLERATKCRLVTVGTDQAARLRVAAARSDIFGTVFELDGRFQVQVNMPGMHHAANAAATFAIARWLGIAPDEIISRLSTYRPLEGRTRLVRLRGLTVIDDAYNANPSSMAAAIETLGRARVGHRVLVMGDMLELGPGSAGFHRAAVEAALESGIETLVAVGSATADAVRATNTTQYPTRVIPCEDAECASETLVRILSPGDVVWIKGSRLMELDRVVGELERHYGQQVAVA